MAAFPWAVAGTGCDATDLMTRLPGAIGEVNDNIMSGGNTIRPQHYATFHNYSGRKV